MHLLPVVHARVSSILLLDQWLNGPLIGINVNIDDALLRSLFIDKTQLFGTFCLQLVVIISLCVTVYL